MVSREDCPPEFLLKVPAKVKGALALHPVRLHAGMFLTLNVASPDASLIWKINSKQQILSLFPRERTDVFTGDCRKLWKR